MHFKNPGSLTIWRWVFLGMEILVVWVVAMAVVTEFGFGVPFEPDTWTIPVIILASLYGISWLFLLIVSPFFLRSLRGIALAGWVIGFGVLLLGMLFPV